MGTKEVLDLILKLDVQGDAQLKGMADNADKAAQRLQELAQKTDIATRTMATQQKELAGLQQQYANTAGKATELADKLDKVVASEGKNSAAATKLQSELDRTATAAQKVAIAIEKKEIALQRGSNALQRIATEAGRTGQALTTEAGAAQRAAQAHVSLTRDTESTGNAFDGMSKRLTSLAAGYFSLQGAIQIVEWGKQGAAMQGVAESFDKLAASAGTTGDELLSAMQKASKGTIADADLMAKANQAVLLSQGRFATELPRLLAGARASAKATGKDVSTAFDDIVTAAARGSAEIADNLGFTVNAAQANKDYADSLGISVDALTKQQQQTAFTNALLNQSDALIKTLGDDTLTSADKIAQAETRITNFTNSLKILAGEGLAAAADGLTYLQQLMAGDGGGNVQAQALAVTAQSYEQYVAAVTSGNQAFIDSNAEMQRFGSYLGPFGVLITGAAQAQAAFTDETTVMSKAQFEASQALQEVGYSAEQANAMVAGLAEQQTILSVVTGALMEAEGLDAEAKKAMIDRTIELASASPEAASEIAGLVEQVVTGQMTGLEYADVLAIMSAESGGATEAALGLANALLVNNDATAGATGAIYDMTDATYEQEVASLNAAIAAEQQARFQDDLAYTADLVASGSSNAAAAEAYLMQMYNLNAGEVANLIALTNELNKTRAGQQGNALARVAGRQAAKITNPDTGGAAGYHQRSVDRAERRERAARGGGSGRKSGGGGGGAGKKAGKSDEVKQAEKTAKELDAIEDKVEKAKVDYQRKVEDAAKKHADKLQAIDEEYFQKNLEATNKFNADKFDTQLGFLESIADVDQEFWDAARAAEDAYWQESQALAQAGHAEQAAALYEAGQEEARIKAENAQQMKDLRRQIAEEEDAEERAKLEQQLARQAEINAREEQLAADKVKKIREGGDQLEQERADAIAKENEDYSEAQDTLKADFQETLADIKTSYADMGAAARELADGIIAAAQAATAAVQAIPMPSASGAPADAAPVGSYATGTGSRGLPRTGMFEGHAGEIILNRKQSDALRSAGGTRAVDSLNRIAAPLAGARTPSVGTAGSVSNSSSVQVNAPITIGGTNAAPADIQRAVAAGIKQGLDEFNRRTGGSAASRKKLGY